jgi:hypothetical protein
LRGQVGDESLGLVEVVLQPMVVRGEFVDAGAEVGGAVLVELLANG